MDSIKDSKYKKVKRTINQDNLIFVINIINFIFKYIVYFSNQGFQMKSEILIK